MWEMIIAGVITGVILMIIERSTGWFSDRLVMIRKSIYTDASSLAKANVRALHGSGRQSSSMTATGLADMLGDVPFDTSKVEVLRQFIDDVRGKIKGEDAAKIVSSFTFDTSIVEALEILSPRLAHPVSEQAIRQIMRQITSATSQEEAAKFLS